MRISPPALVKVARGVAAWGFCRNCIVTEAQGSAGAGENVIEGTPPQVSPDTKERLASRTLEVPGITS
jgi:hypothetical protein